MNLTDQSTGRSLEIFDLLLLKQLSDFSVAYGTRLFILDPERRDDKLISDRNQPVFLRETDRAGVEQPLSWEMQSVSS